MLIFSQFPLKVPFLFQDPIQDPHTAFSQRVSSVQWQFSHPLFSKSVFKDTFKESWSGILRNVPQSGFTWRFLTMRLKLRVWGKNAAEVKYPSHHVVRGKLYDHDIMVMLLTFITWWRWCLPDLLIVKLLFFLFYTLFVRSESVSPEELSSTSWSGGGGGIKARLDRC